MEKFVYICNDQEFIKLLEAFGERMQIIGDFYCFDNVFALQEDKNGTINQDGLFNTEEDSGNIDKIVRFAKIISDKVKTNDTETIYISVHPGGTSEVEIKKVLNHVNEKLNNNDNTQQKIFVTYHGSQNLKAVGFFNKEKVSKKDIVALNKAVTNFILTDIIPILKDFNSRFFSELSLLKQFIDKTEKTGKLNNKSIETLKTIYGLEGYDESIKEKFGDYYSALNTIINKYNEFYSLLKNPEKSDIINAD